MDKDIKRSIILDNYQDRSNRVRHDNDNDYVKINTSISTCIDNIDLYIDVSSGIIKDISFEGEACVISTSSTNILINLIKGKSIDEAINIITHYKKMINEEEYDKNIVGEGIVYSDIYKEPARIKCAILSWDGIYNELIKYKESK